MICAATNRRDTAALPPQPEPPSIVSPVDDLARRLLALQRRNEELEAFVRALAHDAGSLTRGIALRTQLLRERLQGKDAELADIVDALDERGADYASASGTATKIISTGFGELARQGDGAQIELRASWTPHESDLGAHVEAWGDLLCMLAGIPPLPDGVRLLAHRRASRD